MQQKKIRKKFLKKLKKKRLFFSFFFSLAKLEMTTINSILSTTTKTTATQSFKHDLLLSQFDGGEGTRLRFPTSQLNQHPNHLVLKSKQINDNDLPMSTAISDDDSNFKTNETTNLPNNNNKKFATDRNFFIYKYLLQFVLIAIQFYLFIRMQLLRVYYYLKDFESSGELSLKTDMAPKHVCVILNEFVSDRRLLIDKFSLIVGRMANGGTRQVVFYAFEQPFDAHVRQTLLDKFSTAELVIDKNNNSNF